MKQESVAIVGAGTIGCSFAAWFAAKDYQVRIFDVRDNYESAVREMLGTQLAEIPSVNVNEAQKRISCLSTLEQACENARLVERVHPVGPACGPPMPSTRTESSVAIRIERMSTPE